MQSTSAWSLKRYRLLGQLFGASNHPYWIAAKLICGQGSQVTLPQPLPTPRELIGNSDLISQRWDGLTMLRQIPLFVEYDSPLNSIYRMGEFLSADDSGHLMLEMQYFWNGRHDLWRLEDIPDPQDADHERYAILASTVECLVLAFNYRLSLGSRRDRYRGADERAQQQERLPSWTATVPPLEHPLLLRREEDYLPSRGDDPFSRRNITANGGNLFSI